MLERFRGKARTITVYLRNRALVLFGLSIAYTSPVDIYVIYMIRLCMVFAVLAAVEVIT